MAHRAQEVVALPLQLVLGGDGRTQLGRATPRLLGGPLLLEAGQHQVLARLLQIAQQLLALGLGPLAFCDVG